MIWALIVVYHLAIIAIAYKIGSRSAGKGLAVFFVGVAGFQLLALGPMSFLDSGCNSYSIHASSC